MGVSAVIDIKGNVTGGTNSGISATGNVNSGSIELKQAAGSIIYSTGSSGGGAIDIVNGGNASSNLSIAGSLSS